MKIRIEDALQAALEARQRGQDIEALLAVWPAETSAEVRRLLATASEISGVGGLEPPPGAARRGRVRFLRHAESLRQAAPQRMGGLAFAPRFALAALVAALALVLGLGGLTQAAANSLPGDALYPVRVAAQDVRLHLTADPEQRLRLQNTYESRQAEDVARLLALGRLVPVSFHGQVRSMDSYLWDVAGIPVRQTTETRLLGEIRPGTTIEVKGVTQADGTVLADEVRLDSYDTVGVLDRLTANELVVGGQTLALTADSLLEPGLTPGDKLLVRVAIDEYGRLVVVSAALFAPPSPTVAPSATEQPESTETHEATESPESSETEDHQGPGEGTQKPESTEKAESGGRTETAPQTKLDFTGDLQSIAGSQWTVDGRVFTVDGRTELKDDPEIGDAVRVVAFLQGDGSWWAEKIERRD